MLYFWCVGKTSENSFPWFNPLLLECVYANSSLCLSVVQLWLAVPHLNAPFSMFRQWSIKIKKIERLMAQTCDVMAIVMLPHPRAPQQPLVMILEVDSTGLIARF
uniref:Uncharacterized protein n=1 Tax=Sphaerodactylus townsendi TaxID=933632 RepID=A0ACB8EJ21_9SAUR